MRAQADRKTNTNTNTNKSIREMTDRELRNYRRMLRLERERRQKLVKVGMTFMAIFAVFLICVVSGSMKTHANNGFKYYTSITVEQGQTLWTIADDYMDYGHYKDKNAYIAEVESINHLNSDEMLLTGRMLIVPYYSAEYVQ